MPEPQLEPWRWEQLWVRHRRAWAQLLRLYKKRATAQEMEALAAEALVGAGMAAPAAEDEWLCGECGQGFATLEALNGYRRKHGYRDPYRHFVDADGICPVCGKCFWSRYRGVVHLKRGVRCKARVDAGEVDPLDPEIVDANDAAEAKERTERRQKGVLPSAGPRCRPGVGR